MSQSKSFHVRLSTAEVEKLEQLSEALPSLPTGLLLRTLIDVALSGPLSEQVARVQNQLVNPAALDKSKAERHATNNSRHTRH